MEPKNNQLNMFILVEKKQKDPEDDDYDPLIPYYYAPLLYDCASLYPDIEVFVSASVLVVTYMLLQITSRNLESNTWLDDLE